jgi:hypothetical protein
MRKITEYTIINEGSLGGFIKSVNKYLQDGWHLSENGMLIINHWGFYREMVKYEDE